MIWRKYDLQVFRPLIRISGTPQRTAPDHRHIPDRLQSANSIYLAGQHSGNQQFIPAHWVDRRTLRIDASVGFINIYKLILRNVVLSEATLAPRASAVRTSDFRSSVPSLCSGKHDWVYKVTYKVQWPEFRVTAVFGRDPKLTCHHC
jgi:hypothetical protein